MIQILNYIKENRGMITFVLGAIVAFLLMQQCNRIADLKEQVQIAEKVANRNYNNLLASQDTIRLERNINGDLISTISSYEYDIEMLQSSNDGLLERYNEALALNEQYKEINNLISAQLEIKDSIISASRVIMDGDSIKVDLVDNKKWDKYNWRNFRGEVVLYPKDSLFLVRRSIFEIEQGVSLTMAILNVDGRDQLKISSPYPNLRFTNIENINIVNDRLNTTNAKKAGWSIGLGFGYGINLNNQQVINWGPSIGIGVVYSPKWLRF